MQTHTFKAMKKPVLLSFRFAEFDEEIQTLEGMVTARAGDAVWGLLVFSAISDGTKS